MARDLIERAIGLPLEARQPLLRALQALASTRSGELEGVLGRIAPERRPDAVRLLWEAAGPSAMPLLRSALVDPTPAVRIAVLEVLRGTGEPAAVEAATAALAADSAPAVREAAVRLLADAPPARRIECLDRALLDPDPAVRATAVELLPAGAGREAAGPLLRALSDPDQDVRRAAARHVAALPEEDLPLVWSALLSASPELREQVVAVMERSAPDRLARLAIERVAAPEPEQRLLAVELLGRAGAGTPEAVGAAIQALQDVRSEVRRAAAAALASLRSPEAVPALGRSLGDPDPEVRAGAVRALGVIDDEAVLGFLVTALKDPDPEVRRTASEVLTEWSSPAVAKRLAEVLEHPELRGQARELLVKMGPSAVELLVDVLLQASPAVRPEIGRLLERIAGRERFVERLSSIDPDQRLRALQALAAIGGADLVPALLRALADPDERVRILAADLLAEAGDASAVEPLRRTSLSDPVPEVVRAAERALARLRPEG
ncbi:MAG TPA: HEAT repeat domain-containing protein [Actinomycetota bacterium]|nr:HEAT repeat domain-containing protein [Actinomycetota bacterium]